MKKILKALNIIIFFIIFLNESALFFTASAVVPYDTYNYDRWGEAVPSQAGYIAEKAVSGNDLGIGSFNSPEDIFTDHNDIFYITDTKNNRIVAVNSAFNDVIQIYDEFILEDGTITTLKKPSGIYVSEETGLMYIADSENSRVLVCNDKSETEMIITRPESELYTAPTFKPQKVIADKGGNIYVVLGNITTGAAMFTPDGDFYGFYGANRVEPTAEVIGNHFKSIFMSEEKRARRLRSVPTGITNFDIDGDFIFTCTGSTTQKTDVIKKLNAAGNNILLRDNITIGDYTPMYDTTQNRNYKTSICDIDISDDGSINCLDLTTGRIFQYDEECNLLFITGTTAEQLGGFDQVTALESSNDKLYVLDKEKNTVTIFKETSFGKKVHEATSLYNDGYYEKALEPWYEVLKRDGNYRRAYIGIASALLNSGEYKQAMKYARLADVPKIYDKAFEGYRREFVREYFPLIIITLTVSVFIIFILKRKSEKNKSAAKSMDKSKKV